MLQALHGLLTAGSGAYDHSVSGGDAAGPLAAPPRAMMLLRILCQSSPEVTQLARAAGAQGGTFARSPRHRHSPCC
jgi:hypothetical protein